MEEERQFRLPEPPKFPVNSQDPSNFLLKIKLHFTAKPITDYANFLSKFNNIFSNPNLIIASADAMMNCRQGKRTAIDYAAEFRRLSSTSKFNQAALIYTYHKGLNADIMDRLTMGEIPVISNP
ncbi:hypothetical protein BB561_002936 [Smittium simulii]|uniref:Retrotransposon gag domain-containing protein n=1 Tax=Smittium simulii TaxID=133385 RepID=A0A2T9YNT6_9FUNG|nr:hypothetical protein BB561_002936 [Smittium simulii]